MPIIGEGVISVKKPLKTRQQAISALISRQMTKTGVAQLLGCTGKTVQNYRRRFLAQDPAGL
jgi:DNA-binding CsgD family transcriptional regulator